MPPTPSPALQGALFAFQGGHSHSPRRDRLTPSSGAPSTAHSRDPSPRPVPRRREVSPGRSVASGSEGRKGERVSPKRKDDSFIAANMAARVGRGRGGGSPESAEGSEEGFQGTTKLISMFEGAGGGDEGSGPGGVKRGKTPVGRGAGSDGDPVKLDAPRAKTPVGRRRAQSHVEPAKLDAPRVPTRSKTPMSMEREGSDGSQPMLGAPRIHARSKTPAGGRRKESDADSPRVDDPSVSTRPKTPMGRQGAGSNAHPATPDVPRIQTRAKTPAGARHDERAATPRTPGSATSHAPSSKPPLKPKPNVDTALLAARQVGRTLPTENPGPHPPRARSARPPTPPKPRGSNKPTTRAHSASAFAQGERTPEPPPLGREDTGSSDDTFVSASSVQSPPPSPQRTASRPVLDRSKSSKSSSSSPSQRLPPPPRRPQGSLNRSALSSAIVAGSLASSRLSPGSTGDAPALKQPSPRLLPTLRTGEGMEKKEEERRKHRHLRVKRHRHKKKRKKWAGRISERQRRRYEALWASNKGVLVEEHLASLSPDVDVSGIEAGNCVVNVVVRELWRRSRLPDDELEEVWGLVDAEGKGLLRRREFVVGTWLVDQRLRGRKIPARVEEGVWDSASGVKVRH